MRRNPETAIHLDHEPRVRHPSDISIAVRPDAPNLLHWVKVCLANHIDLLDSTETATIFLDRDLRIRRFTAATESLIKLIPADIGGPISDFSLAWGRCSLAASM